MKLIGRILCTSYCFLIARGLLKVTAGDLIVPTKTCTFRSFVTNISGMCEPTNSSDSYVPGSSSVAFVTTPDEKTAKKLARGLIENKLAACVNIIPQIQSIYMWEGAINEDSEYLMMIKTRTSRLEELTKWVRENHSYSVAEVITLPIEQGNVPYLNWIANTVNDKN